MFGCSINFYSSYLFQINYYSKYFAECCYKCEKCDYLFSSKERFLTHVKSKHPDRSMMKIFKCGFCSYSTDCSSNFKKYVRIHTQEKPFECLICSKKFTDKGNLKKHMHVHNQDSVFQCKRCSKLFKRAVGLKFHIQSVHEKDRPHVCKICSLSFGQAGHLKNHMMVHRKRQLANFLTHLQQLKSAPSISQRKKE